MLTKMINTLKSANAYGFFWTEFSQIKKQIQSEIAEVEFEVNAQDKQKIKEEYADLLQATIELGIFLGLDIDDVLNASDKKFNKRMEVLKEIAALQGFSHLRDQKQETKAEIWRQAKEKIASSSSN